MHISLLGEILDISLPLSKYHFEGGFSLQYGLFKAGTINLNLKLGFTKNQTNEAEDDFQLLV